MKENTVYNQADNKLYVKTDGDDMKWILTFRILDGYELKPDLN